MIFPWLGNEGFKRYNFILHHQLLHLCNDILLDIEVIRHRIREVIAIIDDEYVIAPHWVAIIRSGNHGIIAVFFSVLAVTCIVLFPLIKGHRIDCYRDFIVGESAATGLGTSSLEDRHLRRLVLDVIRQKRFDDNRTMQCDNEMMVFVSYDNSANAKMHVLVE